MLFPTNLDLASNIALLKLNHHFNVHIIERNIHNDNKKVCHTPSTKQSILGHEKNP